MIEETTKELATINNLPEVCYQRAQAFNEEVIRLDGIASNPQLLKEKIDVISSQCAPGSRRAVGMYNLGIDSRLVDSGGGLQRTCMSRIRGDRAKGSRFPWR
jgi:hypothetical protein